MYKNAFLMIVHVNLCMCIGIDIAIPVLLCPGSTVTGPVAKECADLWPRIASNAPSIA